MKAAKYSVGTRVKHLATGKWGEVVEVWDDGKGWRYGVWHSGFTWGVPEAGLVGR